MDILDIHDNKNGILTITLSDLLSYFAPINKQLDWSILYLYATGELDNDKSMIDFETKIRKSPNGLYLNWEELQQLASKFDQIYDIFIVGAYKKDKIIRFENDQDYYKNYPAVIELSDGSYWRVFSDKKSIIKELREVCNNTRILKINEI